MSSTDNYDNPGLFLLRSTALLLMLLLSSAATIYVETEQLTLWSGRTIGNVLIVALFVLCYIYSHVALYRERDKQVLLLLWVEAVLLCILFSTVLINTEVVGYLAGFWVGSTPYSYRLRTCVYLTAGVLVLTIGTSLWRGLEWPAWVIVIVVATYIFILSLSYTGVSERRLRREALTLNRQLQAAQQQLAQAARHSERLRIARDMHDVLGHQLTALVLNLEIATHKSQEPALGHIEQALALARMALGDLRNAVSDLRENEPMDFRAALDTMLGQIPGLKIWLDCDANLSIDDPATTEALLRCIQEAVTNTLRHANAHTCTISLHQHAGQLLLDVRDDGNCQPHIEPGNGLHGMRERLQQLAGNLHWQNHQGSFLLQASLPLPGKGL
jgi:signal transduction histidine kinase